MIDHIRIFGDTHGNYQWYKNQIMAANIEGLKTFHVGDFGIGFPRNERWDNYWLEDPDGFSDMNSVIGGNHDNPLYTNKCPLFLSRYGSKNGMFWAHGAYSIDKDWRTVGVNWWDREELSMYEMELAEGIYAQEKPDIVITHDGPFEALRYMFPMQMMNEDVRPSRTQMFHQYLFEIHKPKYWFFGHWHHTLQCEWEGCIFQCIGIEDWVDFNLDTMEIV